MRYIFDTFLYLQKQVCYLFLHVIYILGSFFKTPDMLSFYFSSLSANPLEKTWTGIFKDVQTLGVI